MSKKVGRNDPCPCGSGKKFKKCCGKQMLGKKFRAEKIETTSSLHSLFQKQVSVITKPEKKEEEEKRESEETPPPTKEDNC